MMAVSSSDLRLIASCGARWFPCGPSAVARRRRDFRVARRPRRRVRWQRISARELVLGGDSASRPTSVCAPLPVEVETSLSHRESRVILFEVSVLGGSLCDVTPVGLGVCAGVMRSVAGSMADKGRPRGKDSTAPFCLGGGDAADPLLLGCAYRGSFGWSHAGCLVKSAETARALPPGAALRCLALLRDMQAGLHGPGQSAARDRAVGEARGRGGDGQEAHRGGGVYAYALGAAGEHAEAVRLQRGILDVSTRTLGPDHPYALACASNVATSLVHLGGCAVAAVLLRTTLAARTRTLGPDDANTLIT